MCAGTAVAMQVSDEDVASSVLDNVMVCLDSNHDGRISFEEFKAGFEVRESCPRAASVFM